MGVGRLGIHQVTSTGSGTTSYTYDANQRLQQVTEPSGETVAYTYDSAGNRLSKTVTTGGTSTEVKDVYQGGRIAYQTDGANNLLATFAYDDAGQPSSVLVGSDPTTAPRYYYVYNTHGDVVALVDSSGNAVSSYSYDAFGAVQTDTDNFANGWRNPYLYDGKDDVRYDAETSLYWMSVRAYDPSTGRFISRDPLGRAPALGLATQPYVYADNNPLKNVDPSGQLLFAPDGGGGMAPSSQPTAVVTQLPTTRSASTPQAGHPVAADVAGSVTIGTRADGGCSTGDVLGQPNCYQIGQARSDANAFANQMSQVPAEIAGWTGLGALLGEQFPNGFVIGWFVSKFSQSVVKAVGTLLLAIGGEAFALQKLFSWQASWNDAAWESGTAFSYLIGTAILALTDALFGGPLDLVGNIVSMLPAIVGVGANDWFFAVPAVVTLKEEHVALWGH